MIQLQKRISILLGVFLRACSTDNFLSPILSPNLQSLEHVTTRVGRGEFRVKNVALCLHVCLAFFVAFHQKDCVFIIFISLFDELSNFSERLQTSWKPESVIRNCQWNCMLSRKVFLIKLWNQVLPGLLLFVILIFISKVIKIQGINKIWKFTENDVYAGKILF